MFFIDCFLLSTNTKKIEKYKCCRLLRFRFMSWPWSLSITWVIGVTRLQGVVDKWICDCCLSLPRTFCYRWWSSAHLCWRSTPLESAEDPAGDEGEAEQCEHDDRADAQLGDRRLLLPSQVNLSSQRVLLLPGDGVFVNNITRVICIKTFASIFYYFYTSLVKITSQ